MNGICTNSYTAKLPLKDVQFVIDVHAECSGETNAVGLMLFFLLLLIFIFCYCSVLPNSIELNHELILTLLL